MQNTYSFTTGVSMFNRALRAFSESGFEHDKRTLKELESCPTIPDGATVQNTFDEITLSVKENQIIVSFKANGVNIREGKRWRWSQSDYFEFSKNKFVG